MGDILQIPLATTGTVAVVKETELTEKARGALQKV